MCVKVFFWDKLIEVLGPRAVSLTDPLFKHAVLAWARAVETVVSFIARSLSAGQALRGKKRHPTVEDNVTVYAGTTVMGGDTVIGSGSTVGANVFLTRSVPANSLVYYEEKKVEIVPKRPHNVPASGDSFKG